MRLFLCLSLFVCLACYPDRDPTEDEPVNPLQTAADAGEAQEDPVDESPDAGEEVPEPAVMDAGQEVQEPEPTVDAGSEPVNEETVDAGPQCDVWQQLVKEQPKDQPGEWSKLTSFSNASSRLFKK